MADTMPKLAAWATPQDYLRTLEAVARDHVKNIKEDLAYIASPAGSPYAFDRLSLRRIEKANDQLVAVIRAANACRR